MEAEVDEDVSKDIAAGGEHVQGHTVSGVGEASRSDVEAAECIECCGVGCGYVSELCCWTRWPVGERRRREAGG